MEKFNIKVFALRWALVWGVIILILGILGLFFPVASGMVSSIAFFYAGYATTFVGIFVGVLWAFLDAVALSCVIAWTVNRFGNH